MLFFLETVWLPVIVVDVLLGSFRKDIITVVAPSSKPTVKERNISKKKKIEKQILEILDSFIIKNARLLEWVRKALKESH